MRKIIDEDLEAYADYLKDYRDCIICHRKDYRLWAEYGSYKAVICNGCGFVWIDPSLNKKGLERYYHDYIGMRFKDKIKTKQRAKQYELDKTFIENFVSRGRVLDIGCSGGFFLNVLSDKFEKHGTDIDGPAIEYARNHYPFGENILFCDLKDVEYPHGYFDIIVMRGVIEHLSDPRQAVSKVSELLRKGGYFYIAATPNINSFCAQLYREKWNQFHPIKHLFYFDAKTISQLGRGYGLRLLAADYPYIGTPYADIENDHIRVLEDMQLKKQGKFDVVNRSQAFWGNMMNLVFYKEK